MSDLFISYSRDDRTFVERLHAAVEASGRDAWLDKFDIEKGEKFWQEIERGIDGANAFVFVISPTSIKKSAGAEEYCRREIEYAVRQGKRIIPIVWRDRFQPDERVENWLDKEIPAHRELMERNWLEICDRDFDSCFSELIITAEKDLEYVKFHTKLLENARAWIREGRKDSDLIRGDALSKAEAWLKIGEEKIQIQNKNKVHGRKNSDSEPTADHRDFINQSRLAEEARLRRESLMKKAIILGGGILVLSLVGAGIATSGAMRASKLRQEAEAINRLEDQGNKAIQQFKTDQIGGILSAMKAGEDLKGLMKETNTQEYLAGSPVHALNTIISQLQNQVLLTHQSVEIVKFNSRGDRILTGGNDGVVRIWDTSGMMIAQIKANLAESSQINSASFNLEGDRILTAFNNDKRVKIWDSISGKLLTEVQETGADRIKGNISPNGKLFVTTSNDKNAHIWDMSGKLVSTLNGYQDLIIEASFNNQSDKIIALEKTGNISTYDLTGKLLSTLNIEDRFVNRVQLGLNPARNQAIVTSFDVDHANGNVSYYGKTILYNILENSVIYLPTIGVTKFSFSKDGKYVLTIGVKNKNIPEVWDTSGKLITQLNLDPQNGKDIKQNISFLSADFIPGENSIITTHNDGVVRIWNMAGKVIKELLQENTEGQKRHLELSSNGKFIAIQDNSLVRVWDLSKLGEMEEITTSDSKIAVSNARFSPTGNFVITTASFKPVYLWGISGKPILKLNPDCDVTDAGYSNNEQRVITICDETHYGDPNTNSRRGNIVKLWDIAGNLLSSTIVSYNDSSNFYFDFNNNSLGLNSLGKSLNSIKNISNEAGFRNVVIDKEKTVTGVKLIPDIDFYISKKEKMIQLFDYSGQIIQESQYFDSQIQYASLSPRGDKIAITFWQSNGLLSSNEILLWNRSNKQISVLKGHSNSIASIDFSPVGELIVTASYDKTAKVWTSSGKLIAEFKNNENQISSALFNRKGDQITLASLDRVHIWKLKSLDELLIKGCSWLHAYLKSEPNSLQKLKSCQK